MDNFFNNLIIFSNHERNDFSLVKIIPNSQILFKLIEVVVRNFLAWQSLPQYNKKIFHPNSRLRLFWIEEHYTEIIIRLIKESYILTERLILKLGHWVIVTQVQHLIYLSIIYFILVININSSRSHHTNRICTNKQSHQIKEVATLLYQS